MSDSDKPKERIRTITELARLANVSPATVSRALANKDVINPQTRQRVQSLAREHGFQINQMASKLRRQKTGLIGVVIPLGRDRPRFVSDPFFMDLLAALADELTEQGYDIMLKRAIPHEDARWLDRIVTSGMVDGVLVLGQSDQFEAIEQVAKTYKPLIIWGCHRDGQEQCTIGLDNRAAGRTAGEHLLGKGRRSLIFLGSTLGDEFADRYLGAADAVAAYGAEASLLHIETPISMKEISAEVGVALLANAGNAAGIVAATDAIAMAAIQFFAGHNVKIPDDVALIGFDDLPLARHTVPPLSTIKQDVQKGAAHMVQALLAAIEGLRPSSIIMEPELIERSSA